MKVGSKWGTADRKIFLVTDIKEVDNQSSASERVSQLAVMCKQIARQNEVSLLVLSAVTKMGESDSINKGKIEER